MENQKMEALLWAALDATDRELTESPELASGYMEDENRWEVIVRHTGNLSAVREAFPNAAVTELLGGYGILQIPKNQVSAVASLPSILYMEKPKRFFYETFEGKRAACITSAQSIFPEQYTGAGTIVAVIDSGIDYRHPDFRNPDGSTRILALWDQTIPPDPAYGWNPPEGYFLGTLFTREQINEALSQPTEQEQNAFCPSFDFSGHGTHVAGIAAGNGAASSGVYRGVAYEADLIIVKLQGAQPSVFPNTAQLMQAVDFSLRQSITFNQPLAVNLSFGNSYGSHSGTSLLESYLDTVSGIFRTCIVTGSGNEGNGQGHVGGILSGNLTSEVPFSIGEYERSLNIQIWKNSWDAIRFLIRSPNGDEVTLPDEIGTFRFTLGQTQLYISYGEPSPYSIYQEIYLDFLPSSNAVNTFLDAGIWQITLLPISIREGNFDLWMPSSGARNQNTHFLFPTPDITLTIPSTASKIITVGAYDSRSSQPAAFSGRGFTWSTDFIKPELVAPGVDITSCAPGGGYTVKTGTSMAVPFVTGSVSALMQWGIVLGNDLYLYGEKAKAALIRGAKRLTSITEYPSPLVGWGALCLRDSIKNP